MDGFFLLISTSFYNDLKFVSGVTSQDVRRKTTDGTKAKSKKHMKPKAPFACTKIIKDLSKNAGDEENFVFSPCSIQLAMSLVANGATGSTLKELLTFLEAKDLKHLNSVAEELVKTLTKSNPNEGRTPTLLTFVGGVWIDQSLHLKPTFQTVAQSIYKGQAKAVDFENKVQEVIDEVNQWAEQATNGLIRSLLPQGYLDETTRLVLGNALYFKGKWTEEFDEKRTKDREFYLLNGKSVQVPFMTKWGSQYIEAFEDFKVLRLDYKRNYDVYRKQRESRNNFDEREASRNFDEREALSMYIILPDKRNGLGSLLEKIGDDPLFLEKYVNQRANPCKMGKFWLPKFKITHAFEASDILKAGGLKLPFSNAAEFDEMVQNSSLQISKVLHKSCIEVNEDGTEAAASTLVIMTGDCLGPEEPLVRVDFVADHPFMFIIRDDISGMLLFMGNVVNPSLK